MQITTKAVWNSIDDFIAGKPADERESYEYTGPIAKLDRAAQGEAKDAAATAGGTASSLKSSAQSARSTLDPFFKQEMTTQHAFSPEQTNELLNFAEQGAGGANATLEGEARSQAARTRNTSGFTSALDQAARERQRALSSASLGVAAQDVAGAKALNQAGAAGEAGLYNTDTDSMLRAMGVQTNDIKTQVEAGQSGWFQNLMGIMKATGELASGVGGGAAGAAAFRNS